MIKPIIIAIATVSLFAAAAFAGEEHGHCSGPVRLSGRCRVRKAGLEGTD